MFTIKHEADLSVHMLLVRTWAFVRTWASVSTQAFVRTWAFVRTQASVKTWAFIRRHGLLSRHGLYQDAQAFVRTQAFVSKSPFVNTQSFVRTLQDFVRTWTFFCQDLIMWILSTYNFTMGKNLINLLTNYYYLIILLTGPRRSFYEVQMSHLNTCNKKETNLTTDSYSSLI